MKKANSKRNDLIKAILSRSIENLKKVLQDVKPEKWITVIINYSRSTNSYDGKIVSDEEMEKILLETEKECQLKLVLVNFKENENDPDNKWANYEPSTIFNILNRKS